MGKIETRIEIFEKLRSLEKDFLVRIVNLASCEASSHSLFCPSWMAHESHRKLKLAASSVAISYKVLVIKSTVEVMKKDIYTIMD